MIALISLLTLLTILVGVPIAFSLGIASTLFLFVQDISQQAFVLNLVLGVNSFPLLAVPFFILTGHLMNAGGMTDRIFVFADNLVGWIRGGMGQVNIFASLIFAGMSGAAVADAAGLGLVELKAMRDRGYEKGFSVAVSASSATIGPIIPPSIIMVIYGVTAEVSIGRMFLGGIIPGIVMTLCLMGLTYGIASARQYPRSSRVPLKNILQGLVKVIPSLLAPAIIVGGILTGLFTPTEAGAVAVVYGILIGGFVFKELHWRDLRKISLQTMKTTALILLIVGMAHAFGWILTYLKLPQLLAQTVSALTVSPMVILFLLVGIYLFLGTFMEAAAIVLMTVPVLLPLTETLGIHPIHFGILISMCMSVGTLTPPLGLVMYIMCDIGEISLEQFTREILPFLLILLGSIVIIALFPDLVLFLPERFL